MKAKLLIVDDDTDIVTVLEDRLQASGYTTVIARDGQQALDQIEQESPNLIPCWLGPRRRTWAGRSPTWEPACPPRRLPVPRRQRRARAVALSLVYPEDDPRLEGELTRLRESLPAEVRLLAGGRAWPAYRDALEKVGALPLEDLAHLGSALDDLRKPARHRPSDEAALGA